MGDILESAQALFTNIPNGMWYALLVSATISLFLQLIKKWLEVQSEKVINALSVMFSFIPVVVDYLLHEASVNPSLLGQRTLMIVGMTQLVYQYAIKPTTNMLRDAKNYRIAKEVGSESVHSVLPATTSDFSE